MTSNERAEHGARCFAILMAFQHFAGKSMKVTDFIESNFTKEQAIGLEKALLSIAVDCDEVKDNFSDLGKLSHQIRTTLEKARL